MTVTAVSIPPPATLFVPYFHPLFALYYYFLNFFETGTHSVAQVGPELEILLPQPFECWDYSCAPPHLALLL
jgi:hypothetical protein